MGEIGFANPKEKQLKIKASNYVRHLVSTIIAWGKRR